MSSVTPNSVRARTGLVLKKIEKKHWLGLLIVLIVAALVALAIIMGGDGSKKSAAPNHLATAACGPYRKDGVATLNGHPINVEIAYTPQAKAKGLAGRPCIESDWGMFFDMGKDGQYPFWMKGMKFPIDIVWINSSHTIAAIQPDAQPSSYFSKNPYFINDQLHPARYVLELKAGSYKRLSLDLGQTVSFKKT